MNRFLALTLGLVFLASSTSGFAAANFRDRQYKIAVYDQRSSDGHSEDGRIIDSVLVCVYGAGTKTLSTIYSDNQRTAKTNCITRSQFATDDLISFYGAASSYDIVLAHSDGSVAAYSGVTPTTHRLQLARNGLDRDIIFPMVFNAGGTETDTGLDLPVGAIVYDAMVEVVTVDATETVDVGLLSSETNGDADGFLDGISVAATGIPQRIAYTVGGSETYLSSFLYGALLGAFSVGNDVATDVGSGARLTHFVTGSNATSISYTPSTSDTFVGYGHVMFKIGR